MKELQGTGPNKTEAGAAESKIPPEKTDQYRNLAAELDALRKTETNLLAQFTGQSQYVKQVREQIAGFEQQKRKMEEDYPQLTKPGTLFPVPANQSGPATPHPATRLRPLRLAS